MDTEDREHFKTIGSQLAKQPIGSSKPQSAANLQSRHDQASCLVRAKAIFGCYRRDEAHDPEAFVAALAAILGGYPKAVVDYVADPRTGAVAEFPRGLPNVGQIQEFCDVILRRLEILSQPKAIAKPFVPPPVKPGQIDAAQFHKLVAEGKTFARPVGRFETVDDKWNRNLTLGGEAKTETQAFIDANQKWLNREHAAAGSNPSFETISPSLKALLAKQNAKREEF